MSKKQIFLIHLIFWIVVVLMTYSFLIIDYQKISREIIISTIYKFLLEALDFYIFYLAIITQLLFKRKNIWIFIIVTIIYCVFYILLYAYSTNYLNILLGRSNGFKNIRSYVPFSTYYSILYVILAGLLKFAIEGYKSNQQKLQLQKQNIKTELASLKAQVNPHFLFNVLNTIHSYIRNDSKIAEESIIRLSDIMRYMLYDASRDTISLQKEVEYIKSFIKLQTLRFNNPDFVDFKITGAITNIMIPPLLLTPFIENAFKHGKMSSKSPGIIIRLATTPNLICFTISNYTDSIKPTITYQDSGVGLANVKRRLELTYSQKHLLEIKKEENKFTVSLQIELL